MNAKEARALSERNREVENYFEFESLMSCIEERCRLGHTSLIIKLAMSHYSAGKFRELGYWVSNDRLTIVW